MFKVISTEIKKIVSKPGIYILSFLLAIILVAGVFIYKPTVYQNPNFELAGDTFLAKYAEFDQTDAGFKAAANKNLTNSLKAINNYVISTNVGSYTHQEYMSLLIEKHQEIYSEYQDCIQTNNTSYIATIRNKLITSFEDINTVIENALINSQYGSFPILTTTKNYENYCTIYKTCLDWAKITAESNLSQHIQEFENNHKDKYFECLNNFKYPTLSQDFIATYTSNQNSKYATLQKRLSDIEKEIQSNYNLATEIAENNLKLASEMDRLANQYVHTVNTYSNLIKYELITNAFNTISTKEYLTALHLSSYSNYNTKSLLVRYNYLFENNKSDNDFSKPLTIGITSNSDINGYDYTHFVLKVFSFVIIVYSIMSACHTIAGEVKEGSMRYLAIRPVSRTKLLFGKWLSILSMSVILLTFSTIIALCVGGTVYGFTSKSILTIFNGTTAVTFHPIGMIIISMLSIIFEMMIYSSIALLLSCLFKSDLMSMTILLVIYLLNMLMPMFIQSTNSWLAFYPFSHISIYSFFGSSVYAVSNNFFNLIFGAKIYAGSHFALTVSMITLFIVIITFSANKLFGKKEL